MRTISDHLPLIGEKEGRGIEAFREMVAEDCAKRGTTPEEMCNDIERMSLHLSKAYQDGAKAYANAWRDLLGVSQQHKQLVREVLDLTEEECGEVLKVMKSMRKE